MWNMPHVIRALDDKHAMDCPKGSGTQDYNYKSFYSFVLLAVCDAKYNFTMVDVGQYGSNNDSGVLINSEVGQKFEGRSFDLSEAEKLGGCPIGELPYYLVSDEIFPFKTLANAPVLWSIKGIENDIQLQIILSSPHYRKYFWCLSR